MPLSEMDYAEELHAQAAAKQRERQQAKLLERAENLQHMAALAGDAADSDLDSLLRQQGKEIGNAARRLGVDMDELKQQAGPGCGAAGTATAGRRRAAYGDRWPLLRPACHAKPPWRGVRPGASAMRRSRAARDRRRVWRGPRTEPARRGV